MAKLQTCQDAFRVGRAERDNHPLRSGLYKLEEARQDIESWRELLSTIAARLRSGGTFGADENLGPCMAQERGIYLKGLPGRLAQLIGYKILPGIAALGGDGIPRVEVERLLHSAQTKAQHLIADCESVRLRLEGGIDHEYREMRQGNGALIGLLGAANELLDTPPVLMIAVKPLFHSIYSGEAGRCVVWMRKVGDGTETTVEQALIRGLVTA